MTDEEKQLLLYRLFALSEAEAVAREEGDPAELLGRIRLALGVWNFDEAGNATRDAGHVEPAAA